MNDSRGADGPLGTKPSRERPLVLGIVVAIVLLVAFPVVDWRISIWPDAGGYYAVWNEDRSRFFISATNGIVVVNENRHQLAVEATIFHGLGRGPMGYDRGWLFYVAENAADSANLLAMNVSDLSRIDSRGPVYLGAAAGAGIWVRSILAEDGITLFAGEYVEPRSGGVVLALDLSDPSSISNESSLRVAYKLEFGSLVTDVMIRGSVLYVLELDGLLHSFDRLVTPPTILSEVALPGTLVDMDMLGPLLALVDAGTNRSVRFYDHSTLMPVLISEVSLPGRPLMVTLDQTRASVSWRPDNFVQHAVTIYDVSRAGSPKTLVSLPLDDFGDGHIEDDGVVYALGHHEVASLGEQIIPFFASPLGLPSSAFAISLASGYLLFRRVRTLRSSDVP